jgi:hypothetical protein
MSVLILRATSIAHHCTFSFPMYHKGWYKAQT